MTTSAAQAVEATGMMDGTLLGVARAIYSLGLPAAEREAVCSAWSAHRGYDEAKAYRLVLAAQSCGADSVAAPAKRKISRGGELTQPAPVGARGVHAARKPRKCITDGQCSSFGSGRSCGAPDCDGR